MWGCEGICEGIPEFAAILEGLLLAPLDGPSEGDAGLRDGMSMYDGLSCDAVGATGILVTSVGCIGIEALIPLHRISFSIGSLSCLQVGSLGFS